MSRAAGGTYTLPAGNPVVTGTVISSTWGNTTLSDIATALTDSLSRSGLGGMTAALLLTDGAVGSPSLSFTNEPTSGLYRAAAGDVRFSLLGADSLKIAAAGLTTIGSMTSTAFIPSGNSVPTNGLYLSAANTIAFSSNTTLRGSVNSTGNWAFAAPSSGVTIAVTTVAAGSSLTLSDGTVIGQVQHSGAFLGFGSTSNHPVSFFSNGSSRLSISADGHVTIAVPTATSTPTLVVNGAAARTTLRLVPADSASVGFQILDPGANATDIRINTNNTGVIVQCNGTSSTLSLQPNAGVLVLAPTVAASVALTVQAIAGVHSTQIADSTNALFNAGFLESPINTKNVAYTTVLSDSGKSIYHSDGTARTYTIDSNANVPYPIGTIITFINDASAAVNVTISITTDTLFFATDGTTGSRTLARYGRATAQKVTATRWQIGGIGLT